jgi:hypothetical protein
VGLLGSALVVAEKPKRTKVRNVHESARSEAQQSTLIVAIVAVIISHKAIEQNERAEWQSIAVCDSFDVNVDMMLERDPRRRSIILWRLTRDTLFGCQISISNLITGDEIGCLGELIIFGKKQHSSLGKFRLSPSESTMQKRSSFESA